MLLIGPPGSGKSQRILEAVRGRLRMRNDQFRLLVPTSTMAEHLRHSLAREGFVFRPDLIVTLSGFVDSLDPGLQPLTPIRLRALVRQSLRRLSPPVFEALSQAQGFLSALGSTMEEISSAGVDARRLSQALDPAAGAIAHAFASLYLDVEAQAEAEGYGFRHRRLALTAARIRKEGTPGIQEVFADGFFSFTDPELDVLEALASQSKLTVTLPDWPGARPAWLRLTLAGLPEVRLQAGYRRPEVTLVEAETQEREAEEIAARILELTATGVLFRDIGIVVRQHDPYVPLLVSTLDRFGIPVRSYFAARLSDHPVVRYYQALVRAALGGWDHEQTLAALSMTASGLASRTDFDPFARAVRERIPGQGLAALRSLARSPAIRTKLDELSVLEDWTTITPTPEQWARRLSRLRHWIAVGIPESDLGFQDVLAFRQAAAACEAFDSAVEEVASALPASPTDLRSFWQEVEQALRLTPLPSPDRRRNVVHLLEVHEARQWELPVVFVCGLLEKQFPMHHSQNPFLNDEIRRQLQRKGFRLSTADERDLEEEFLFQFSLTRATRNLVLSHPRFNAKGDPTLRSFLLDRYLEEHPEVPLAAARPVRSAPTGPKAPLGRAGIRSDDLVQLIASKHRSSTPTKLERFLQCPFQFFASETLRLEEPPARPGDRLDALLRGSIVHKVLEECLHRTAEFEDIFEGVFSRHCSESFVPPGYRSEMVRLSLARNLRRFLPKLRLAGVEPGLAEREYTLELDGGLTLRCKLDRIDSMPDGRSLIIDYKYSARNTIAEFIRELGREDQRLVHIQAGTYMAALEQSGATCGGFLFAAVGDTQGWAGWQISEEPVEGATSCSREELDLVIRRSVEAAVGAAARLWQGAIAPDPADPDHCEHCAFRDICRVETAALTITAGGALTE